MGLALAVIWGIGLALPSAGYLAFPGLPFASVAQCFALALLLPILVSGRLRGSLEGTLGRLGRHAGRVALVLGVVILLSKAVLLTAGGYEGFRACYRSLAGPPAAVGCERSYDNPLQRFSATRIDPTIDFGPRHDAPDGEPVQPFAMLATTPNGVTGTNWNLSFVNSDRFNDYSSIPNGPTREALPFTVTWTGVVSPPPGARLYVTYVGAASVQAGGQTTYLSPSYRASATVALPLTGGRRAVKVVYRFARTVTNAQLATSGPYATMRLLFRDRSGALLAVRAASVAGPWRALALLVDCLIGALMAAGAVLYAGYLRRYWSLAIPVALGSLALLASTTFLGGARDREVFVAAAIVLWGLTLLRDGKRGLLAMYFGLVVLSTVAAVHGVHHLNDVFYRDGGQDSLTLESAARSILTTGSLRGEESVFYAQPGMRYVQFLLHFVFGDSDALLFAVALLALNLGVCLACLLVMRGSSRTPGRIAIGALFTLLLLLLVNAPQVTDLVRAAYSEYPTWGLGAVGLALVAVGREPRTTIAAAVLLVACLLLRSNQILGLLLLVGISTAWAVRRHRRAAFIGAGIFVLAALLPLLHNLYYGGHAVLFTTSSSINKMPFSNLLHIGSNDAAGIHVRQQLRGLAYLHPTYSYIGTKQYIIGAAGSSRWLQIAIHGLQILWIVAAVRIALRWRAIPVKTKLLMLAPIAYLAPHVIYDVLVAYPRHIIIGYVAMGLVALYALTRPLERAQRDSGPEPGAVTALPQPAD